MWVLCVGEIEVVDVWRGGSRSKDVHAGGTIVGGSERRGGHVVAVRGGGGGLFGW